MVKKQKKNLAVFGPFLDLQEFLKNRGLRFETSDSDFCDLLDELFYINEKNFILMFIYILYIEVFWLLIIGWLNDSKWRFEVCFTFESTKAR